MSQYVSDKGRVFPDFKRALKFFCKKHACNECPLCDCAGGCIGWADCFKGVVRLETLEKMDYHEIGYQRNYEIGLMSESDLDYPTDKTDTLTPVGPTGFVRDAKTGKGRMDLLPWYAILDLSVHCERGAAKFGERNIDKGAPLSSLLSSGGRHLAQYIAGETDEDHLVSACWNLMWALQQRRTHPELNDLPWGGAARDEDGKADEAEW